MKRRASRRHDPGGRVALALDVGKRKHTRVQAYIWIMDVPNGMSLVVASDLKVRAWFSSVVRPRMAEAFAGTLEAGTVLQVDGLVFLAPQTLQAHRGVESLLPNGLHLPRLEDPLIDTLVF